MAHWEKINVNHGAIFKRFIVVVYGALRQAATHINGNKPFNCSRIAVYASFIHSQSFLSLALASEKYCYVRVRSRGGRWKTTARRRSSMTRLQQQGNHHHHHHRRRRRRMQHRLKDRGGQQLHPAEPWPASVISTIFDAILIRCLAPTDARRNDYTVEQKRVNFHTQVFRK